MIQNGISEVKVHYTEDGDEMKLNKSSDSQASVGSKTGTVANRICIGMQVSTDCYYVGLFKVPYGSILGFMSRPGLLSTVNSSMTLCNTY